MTYIHTYMGTAPLAHRAARQILRWIPPPPFECAPYIYIAVYQKLLSRGVTWPWKISKKRDGGVAGRPCAEKRCGFVLFGTADQNPTSAEPGEDVELGTPLVIPGVPGV